VFGQGRPPSWAGTRLVEAYPYVSYRRGDFERLERAGLLPADPVPPRAAKRLKRLPASAAAVLVDGSLLPRVVFAHEDYVRDEFIPFWLHFIRPRYVADVRPSPNRFPPRIAERVGAAEETSRVGIEFQLVMRDKRRFACQYAEPSEFVELPGPYHPEDIVDIVFSPTPLGEELVLVTPDYVWCVYR